MTFTNASRRGGNHRKAVMPTSGRIAIAALAATTVASTASGAAAADTKDKAVHKAADKKQTTAQEKMDNAPMILAAGNFSPVTDLSTQLATALQYNQERVARDLQARAPMLSVPAVGTFTSGFGPRWGTFHSGVDIANAIGTPIMAVMDGTVIDSGPASGYGNWIRIRHDDGAISVYGHMETLAVAVGERVRAGQQIAGMGSRGFSTGSHLHFEIHPDGTTAVDPVAWFLQRGLNLV